MRNPISDRYIYIHGNTLLVYVLCIPTVNIEKIASTILSLKTTKKSKINQNLEKLIAWQRVVS